MQKVKDRRRAFTNYQIEMTTEIKKYTVKIPPNISMSYCENTQVVIFYNSFKRRALKLKLKLSINSEKKTIQVTQNSFFSVANHEKKKLRILQATYVVLIKQLILEIETSFCKRLVLVGVGYKVVLLQISNINILHLKLGYSHSIFIKVPKTLQIFCLKANKFFIKGDSYRFVTQIAAIIRAYKTPEPYKGKGILYSTEKITLKEGKKL